LNHRVFLLCYFPTWNPASLACAQVEWENAAISGEINAGYGADCRERDLQRTTARFPSATGTNHSASANGTTNAVQPVAKSFNPPLSPPKDRTVSDEACDKAGRTGSDSLALQIQTLSENAVAVVYTGAIAWAPSGAQDRYGAAGAFLRYCPSYASLCRVQPWIN
jgi:hypothetical protein